MSGEGRCGATIEGFRYRSGIVHWRGSCRRWPKRGYEHCRDHLTADEFQRMVETERKEQQES